MKICHQFVIVIAQTYGNLFNSCLVYSANVSLVVAVTTHFALYFGPNRWTDGHSRAKKPLCQESNIRLLKCKSKQGFRTHEWKADSFFRSFPSSLRRQALFSGLKWIGRSTLRSLLAAFSPLGCIQIPFPKHLFRITYTQTLKQLSPWPSVGCQKTSYQCSLFFYHSSLLPSLSCTYSPVFFFSSSVNFISIHWPLLFECQTRCQSTNTTYITPMIKTELPSKWQKQQLIKV